VKIHFLLIVSLVLCLEIFIRLHLYASLKVILIYTGDIFKLIRSKEEDEIKQKNILVSSKNLLLSSLKVFFKFLIIIFIFLVCYFFDKDYFKFLFSLFGIIEAIIISLGYLKIRKIYNAKL
tara:strand:+ start:115 stop:477 length:363 start_codon:yes stop_codon:yes gene_type:complete